MNTANNYPRLLKISALIVAIAAGAYIFDLIYKPLIQPVLDAVLPFLIAFVIAYLLDPIVDWLQKKKCSRRFGVTLVGLSFLAIFVIIGLAVVPRIIEQATSLADNTDEYVEIARGKLDTLLKSQKSTLERFNLPTKTTDITSRFSSQLQNAASSALSAVASALTSALSRILWIIIIPLSTLWFLNDIDHFRKKFELVLPEQHREKVINMLAAVGSVFARYIRGMLTVALLFSIVSSVILSLFKLQYGLIIGVVSGALYVVPYLGAAISILITAIAAIVQEPNNLGYAGLLVGTMAVLNWVIFDIIVTPRVVGGSVGLHPVLSLFALALGAKLFGVFGMIVAVPVFAAIQVALGEVYPQIKHPNNIKSESIEEKQKSQEEPSK